MHSYLQKEEIEERQKREGKDDRSFFQKYVRLFNHSSLQHTHIYTHTHTHIQWVYIVIGVFILMTLNGAGQAAGGGGGG